MLDSRQAKKKLDRLQQEMRDRSCINALRKLINNEPDDILKNALNFYLKNNYLTPKFAAVIFWKLKEKGIDHNPSFFKINLNKNKYKQDLRDMDTWRVHTIWQALSSSQKKMAISYGHIAPNQ